MSVETVAWANVRSGAAGPAGRYGPFTHASIIRYAGAVGEYNDLHQDVDVARAAGYPDVFVQGMFVGGLVAQRLWNWLGDDGRLRRFRMRVVAPTFRGETLELTSVFSAATHDGTTHRAELEATVVKGVGVVVLRAWATLESA
jgi:acyl dehydratase